MPLCEMNDLTALDSISDANHMQRAGVLCSQGMVKVSNI